MLASDKVSFKYRKNKRQILSDLSITVNDGEFVAVMGESGSGKSTFLAVMAGILTPDSGRVLFNDTDIYSLKDEEISRIHQRNICYVPQSNIMLKHQTVLENITRPYKDAAPESDLKKRALELLEKLGIGDLAENFPYELSGGELKRASLVRAVLMDPDIVIADEPTTGLDSDTGDKILDFLYEYSNSGKAVLVVTHDEHIEKYASKIVKIIRGKT